MAKHVRGATTPASALAFCALLFVGTCACSRPASHSSATVESLLIGMDVAEVSMFFRSGQCLLTIEGFMPTTSKLPDTTQAASCGDSRFYCTFNKEQRTTLTVVNCQSNGENESRFVHATVSIDGYAGTPRTDLYLKDVLSSAKFQGIELQDRFGGNQRVLYFESPREQGEILKFLRSLRELRESKRDSGLGPVFFCDLPGWRIAIWVLSNESPQHSQATTLSTIVELHIISSEDADQEALRNLKQSHSQ